MSRKLSLLASLCGVGILMLLISLARTDLSRVPADSGSLELRQSVIYGGASSSRMVDKRQLLAFIGVQVCM